MNGTGITTLSRFAGVTAMGALALLPLAAGADHLILDDLIVDGSTCIGIDCVNGESFGYDTLRLKENNLRIKFQDTSSIPCYPSNDWQITANESRCGGANKFSIDDISGGRTPFTIEASAPTHSLYVDSGGSVGIGTSNPSRDLHVVSGETPTLRLEQDGSAGFDPQTWDLAGNEANFFVRDVTHGSRLPLRIVPGAPSNSVHVRANGNVGVGTSSASAALHVRRSDASASLLVEETNATIAERVLFTASNNGPVRFLLDDTRAGAGGDWSFKTAGTDADFFQISKGGTGVNELQLEDNGDLSIRGVLRVNGFSGACPAASCFPDYVFDPGYELMPLARLAEFVRRYRHLPDVPSAEDIRRAGSLNMTEMQLRLLLKVEELTLYLVRQQGTIDRLEARLEELTGRTVVLAGETPR